MTCMLNSAVRQHVEAHREDITHGVQEALHGLDGSLGSAVSLLTGMAAQKRMSAAQFTELGGLPEECSAV